MKKGRLYGNWGKNYWVYDVQKRKFEYRSSDDIIVDLNPPRVEEIFGKLPME